MPAEPDYSLFELSPGPISRGLRDGLMTYIEEFEPLHFEAASKAKAWLETNVSAGSIPMDTYLVFSEEGDRLLGFFALKEEEVAVAPEDMPIMMVRDRIEDPYEKQLATKLVWIVRSHDADDGLGDQLFEHVLVLATEAGGCAVLVEPYDDDTKQKLWIDHFHLREPRAGSAEWTCLWYALGEVDQDFC